MRMLIAGYCELYMYVCMYVCMYIYIYIHFINTYVYICTYTYIPYNCLGFCRCFIVGCCEEVHKGGEELIADYKALCY